MADEKEKERKLPELRGTASVKKKSVWSRIAKEMIADEVHDLKEHLIFRILVPTVKSTIRNLFVNAVDMTLYGRSASTRDDRDSRRGAYVAYSASSRNAGLDAAYMDRARERKTEEYVDVRKLEGVEFPYEEDAKDVVNFLLDMIEDYGKAKVSDFLAAARLPTNSIHPKWGWYDITGWKIAALPTGGFCVILPRPEYFG